jgi:hypothetical protein
LAGVAEHGSGLAGQGRCEDAIAAIGLRAAAWSEVVRGAADGDLNTSGDVGCEEVAGHPRSELPLLGVGVVRAVSVNGRPAERPYM